MKHSKSDSNGGLNGKRLQAVQQDKDARILRTARARDVASEDVASHARLRSISRSRSHLREFVSQEELEKRVRAQASDSDI